MEYMESQSKTFTFHPFLQGLTVTIREAPVLARLVCFCLGAAMCAAPSSAQSSSSPASSSTVTSSVLSRVPNPVLTIPSSVTLSGTATWTVGNTHDSGNLTLRATSTGGVEEDWDLSTVHRTIKRDPLGATRKCQSVDATGTVKDLSQQGCFKGIPWFAPWLAYKISADGHNVPQELTSSSPQPGQSMVWSFSAATPDIPGGNPRGQKMLVDVQRISAVRVQYDPETSLPTRLESDDYPNSDPDRKIETYVLFSDYREEHGMMLPHHIQRYVQRNLELDLQVTSVSTN